MPLPTYGTTVNQREICLFTNWDFGSTFYTTAFKKGDAIMLIYPSYRYTYRLAAVLSITYTFGPASGSAIYIDYYISSETYYLIILSANVPVGTTLFLNNVKNANDVLDFGADGLSAPVN